MPLSIYCYESDQAHSLRTEHSVAHFQDLLHFFRFSILTTAISQIAPTRPRNGAAILYFPKSNTLQELGFFLLTAENGFSLSPPQVGDKGEVDYGVLGKSVGIVVRSFPGKQTGDIIIKF